MLNLLIVIQLIFMLFSAALHHYTVHNGRKKSGVGIEKLAESPDLDGNSATYTLNKHLHADNRKY